VESPAVFIFDGTDREEDAAADLAQRVSEIGIETPFILSSRHGELLASKLQGPRPPSAPARSTDQTWAADLGAAAKEAGTDAIVAIGGGRCLDVGKLAAARAGVPVIAVPTQLSHDGICSPVAVVPNEEGRAESVGAVAPHAVYIALPTLHEAPVDTVAAGIGDLIANPLALRDWTLAHERGLEEIDARAWDLSIESYEAIEPSLDRDPEELARDPEFLRVLANALVLSGLAMIASGTSRPASGGEHEVSHAIDELHGGRTLHGAQVAFGCIVSVALYGDDTELFRQRLDRLRLPTHPSTLGLDEDATVEVLLEAPQTRPGRFTILEDANLDRTETRDLVRRIWGS